MAATFRQISLRFTVALVTFIIGVMCTVFYLTFPLVRKVEIERREVALTDTLRVMRDAISEYAHKQGRLPTTLDDLVTAKVLPKILIDPITQTTDWQLVKGTELNGFKAAPGIVNVRCRSTDKSSKGTPYSEW